MNIYMALPSLRFHFVDLLLMALTATSYLTEGKGKAMSSHSPL